MKTSILACLVALAAVAGFAQAPGENPSTPAVLASPAAAIPAAKQPLPTKSTCIASCGGSSTVSCSAPGSCTAVDRNCGANERGHVTCSNGTVNCAASCACGTVCNCAAPCFTTPCDAGGGVIIDCSSWGICTTSCYCGGECLQGGDQSSALSGGNCATPATTEDPLLAKIFG